MLKSKQKGELMNEKEKMIAGLAYSPSDAELMYDRTHIKTMCQKYNQISPKEYETRMNTLKKMLGKTGEHILIEPNFYCDYGYNIETGNHFYANHNLVILDCAKVKFGDNVMIGPNCGFYTAAHPIDPTDRKAGIEFAKPITVGNNVWFGGNVCVMPGVSIGDNTVIGAGSVVTKDIPPNVVAVGNPCKPVKNL